jgi:hypothetical protein
MQNVEEITISPRFNTLVKNQIIVAIFERFEFIIHFPVMRAVIDTKIQ